MALNMGIKAARNEHLVFTTTDSYPCSPSWLLRMAAGFGDADIVLGYCGMEASDKQGNRRIRLNIVCSAARWLSAAMRGRPYRGTMRNMGFTKSIYFDNNGFNHLNLNIGEDDLFLQRIVASADAAVVLEPDSFVRRRQWGGLKWWRRERLLLSNAFRLYPARVRRYIGAELWSRVLFFAGIAALAIVMPVEIKIFAAALLIIRYAVVAVQAARVSRCLSERGLWSVLCICDLFSPLYEAVLYVKRRFKRTPGLWR
jgi:glycosyltransferase involved in cell wall biosynthesis